jgi:hypothetical protein
MKKQIILNENEVREIIKSLEQNDPLMQSITISWFKAKLEQVR